VIRKGIDYGDIHTPSLGDSMIEEKKPDEELEKGSDIERVRAILADEVDGSGALDQIIQESEDPRVKEVFEAIREDEQKHVAALQQLAEMLGSGEEASPEAEEVSAQEEPPADEASELIDDIREVLEEHEAEKQDEGDQEDDLEKECGKIQKAYSVPIIVSKGDQMIVYGVVSEPEVVDLQGDRLSESEIRKACHRFMQTGQEIRKEHSEPAKASIIESYIAPTSFKCNGQQVRKGSWVMAVKVHDPSLWQDIKSGNITGFSIHGTGSRIPVSR